MTCEVKEAKDQPGIFWIEDEKGNVICDFYRLNPYRRAFAYPDAEKNAKMFCEIWNEREEK